MGIEDIKKEILSRITRKYKKIPKEKIIQWINNIPLYEFEPGIIIEDKAEVSEENLFNRKVPEIIDFLSKYKDYILEERWSSYEDNYFMFVIKRPENLDEIAERVCKIVELWCCTFLERDNEIEGINEQIRKLENRKNILIRERM